jgi:hypothetical protein
MLLTYPHRYCPYFAGTSRTSYPWLQGRRVGRFSSNERPTFRCDGQAFDQERLDSSLIAVAFNQGLNLVQSADPDLQSSAQGSDMTEAHKGVHEGRLPRMFHPRSRAPEAILPEHTTNQRRGA